MPHYIAGLGEAWTSAQHRAAAEALGAEVRVLLRTWEMRLSAASHAELDTLELMAWRTATLAASHAAVVALDEDLPHAVPL